MSSNNKETFTSKKKSEERRRLVDHYEGRRQALGLSKRRVSIGAFGLNRDTYYTHWIAGHFAFPGVDKINALNRFFDCEEEVERLRTLRREEAQA